MDFFKLVNDLNSHSQSKEKNTSLKSFTTEYSQENNSWNIVPVKLIQPMHKGADLFSRLSDYSNILKQPPRT